MSDLAGRSSGRSQIAEVKVTQFIINALRAGQRAILVTGRGQVSMRVPETALGACANASARTLHIRPPLPEPPELQEMIGAAVGIAGGRETSPEAMARLLLFAEPRPTVILAIDEAHTLPYRSLFYLNLMTELLASDAPILQIVFAAGPPLLHALAQPEFEGLKNRLCQPDSQTFHTLHGGRPDRALLGPRKRALGRAASPAYVQNAYPWDGGIALPVIFAAVAVVAMSCLAAIGFGYIALPNVAASPTLPSIPWLNSAAPQKFPAPSDPSQSTARLGLGQTDEATELLIDEVVNAVAIRSVEATSLLEIAKSEAGASPEELKLAIALLDRLAARAADAAAAGHVDEARRLEQAYVLAYSAMGRPDLLTASRRTAIPNALGVSNIGDPAQHGQTEERPGLRPDVSGPSTAQLGEASKGDLAASSPNPAASAPLNSAPEQKGDGARPAILAEAAPPATRVVPGLPTFAPVRVVLSVAGGGVRSSRSADIQQALLAAGLQVADLVAVGDQHPKPSIGYYFQSDRDAAAGVSHLLKPLLGAVDPVALRIRGSMPEPGTIEIAIP